MMLALPGTGVVPVLLADGRTGIIRPLDPMDESALGDLAGRMSADSLYRRFFAPGRHHADVYAHHLCHDEGAAARAIVLETDGIIVGVAAAEDVAPGAAEVSFLVEDAMQGHGVGTLLLEHLTAALRTLGVTTLEAQVLAENGPMLRVFGATGFDIVRHDDHGVATLRIVTDVTNAALEAADARERQAESRSLRSLLTPHVVAVVGAGRRRGGTGREVLENILAGGYTGRVVAVNRAAERIGDVACYPDLTAIPEQVDLAVVAVPAPTLGGVVDDACRAGVGAMVILSAGLAETGPEGRRAQDELVSKALVGGVRIVGPNCLGVLNSDPDVRLDATLACVAPPPGGLAIAVQSGGVAIALVDVARRSGLGVSRLVSMGNKADVSGNDLLAAWTDDSGVTAAALYLESFGNPVKFARLARRFSQRKPLLAMRSGTSEAGRRAGLSHTASAITSSTGVEALFAATGVITVDDVTELADTARLLTTQPLPAGPRLVVVSNAGGLGVLAADAADREGLDVAPLTGLVSDAANTVGLQNPADLGAGATPRVFGDVAAAVLASDDVDAAMFIVAATRAGDAAASLERIGAAMAGSGHPLPVALVVVGMADRPLDVAGAPVFDSVAGAARALGHALRYARWRSSPPGEPRPANPAESDQAVRLATAALTDRPGGGWLDPSVSAAMLAAYHVPVVETMRADTPEAAVAAATVIGPPVVIKATDPDVVHKTEHCLVRTGLVDDCEIRTAVEEMAHAQGLRDAPVLVQPQVDSGVEIAVGMVRDPVFGPLVMLAAGGVTIDVLDDRVFLLPPVTDADAARAVRALRVWQLLAGFRGAVACDVPAVERLVQSVAQLAIDVPQLAELDINPVVVTPAGVVCVDVKARLEDPALGTRAQQVGRP